MRSVVGGSTLRTVVAASRVCLSPQVQSVARFDLSALGIHKTRTPPVLQLRHYHPDHAVSPAPPISETIGTNPDGMEALEDEPLSTLADPLPLPSYAFDATLSEDENFITWCCILARHSSSKKGHMGTIFVRPPTHGNPADGHPSSECQPPAAERIVQHANNVPILYAAVDKSVPEVHAEALAIARCARKGIALEGCTVYVSFPPCSDCMKVLLGAGVARCVYKKTISPYTDAGQASLIAARAHGVELVGSNDAATLALAAAGESNDVAAMQEARRAEHVDDEERAARVRDFWASVGEDAARTRARVARWWDKQFWQPYEAARRSVQERYGTQSVEAQERQRQVLKEDRALLKRELKAARKAQVAQGGVDDADLDTEGDIVPPQKKQKLDD